jgi:vacuolar-type H+-ATPase subunit C/Vma6
MKGKKVTIAAKGASVKQWSDLILELNLMKKAWHRYGVTLNIQAPEIKKILSWGTRKYDAKN